MRYFVHTYSQKDCLILSNRTYNAKVLLLGEFTIIDGGSALSLPFPGYSGQWKAGGNVAALTDFFTHLCSLDFINKEKVDSAINSCFEFVSTIPEGYGLGSSGALSAASFDLFSTDSSGSTENLKSKLADIESFFHGNSSGLDPLTSYLNKALLVSRGDVIIYEHELTLDDFYLFDSGRSRNTRTLVKIFNHKKLDRQFNTRLSQLNELNEALISAFNLKSDPGLIMKDISVLQLGLFTEMIPGDIRTIWRRGLDSDQYYLKLSGAGGGGFFLLYNNASAPLPFMKKLVSLKTSSV